MRIFRIANTRYANDLSGEGARLHGGRWNHIGIPCLYAAQSRSLSVLEFSVNVNVERILRHLSMIEIEIPDNIWEVSIHDLPGNWREAPSPSSTKDFGTQLLNEAAYIVIKIPSSVIAEEFDYLINPRHPRCSDCRIIEIKDFVYDVRIKSV